MQSMRCQRRTKSHYSWETCGLKGHVAEATDRGFAVQDVASGVPMAQSTEQLQSLLKDMGFTGPPPRDSCATDPSGSQGGAQQGTSAAAAEHASAVRAHQATLDMFSAMDASGSSAHDALRQTLLQQQQRQQEQPLLPLGRSSSGYAPSPSPDQPYEPTALQRKSQKHQSSASGSQHQSHSSRQQEQQQQEPDACVEHAILVAAAAAGREQNKAAQEFRRQSDHEQQAPAISSLPYSIPEGRNEGARSEAGSCSEHSNHLQRGSGSASGPRDWLREATSTSANATLDSLAELPPGNAIRERPRIYANRSAPGNLRASDAQPSEWQQMLQGSGCVHGQQHPSAASIAAGGGLPTLPQASGRQPICSADNASGQQQWHQTRPSERLPPPNRVRHTLTASALIPALDVLCCLQPGWYAADNGTTTVCWVYTCDKGNLAKDCNFMRFLF